MTLSSYRAELVLQEPATLGIESETAFRRDVYRYVPGIVLRGALAANWIGEFGPPDGPRQAPFRALFEVGLRPGPLLPVGGYLRPLSVVGCKHPPDDAHAAASLHDQAFDGDLSDCRVPGCRGPVEAGRGEVEFLPGTDPVETRSHVPHDRRGVAADQGLHSRHYLRPGTRLTGRLSAPASDGFLERFADGAEIWLGGRRTVAGRARLTLTAERPGPAPVVGDEPVVLRLESPGVFVDAAGRPSSYPCLELADTLGLAVDQIELVRRWWRPVTVRGWHLATGLPKPTDHAVAAGSTWLVQLSGPLPRDRLAALAVDGIGLRRTEGFGQVTYERWRPPSAAGQPVPVPEPALEYARRLWSYLAGSVAARSDVIEHLRVLAGAPPQVWPSRSDAWWRTPTGERIARTGVRPVLAELIGTGEPALVRDVRLVLEAAGIGSSPRWLTLALNPGSNQEGR